MANVVTDQNLAEFADRLGEEDIYNQVAFVVEFLTETPSSGECYRFLNLLEPLVRKHPVPSTLRPKYEQLILKLKFIALPMLELSEVRDLFQNHILFAINARIDLENRIKFFFPEETRSAEDIGRKNALVQAFEASLEAIGSSNIDLNGKQVAPSVSNWIQTYKLTVGSENHGNLGVARFITENKNVSQLDQNSKELLKNTLAFYDWMRFKALELNELFQTKPALRVPPSASLRPIPPKPVKNPNPPSTHGQDLEVLRRQMQNKVDLAPKSVLPSSPRPAPMPKITAPPPATTVSSVKMTPEEIKRETATRELPSPPKMATPVAPKPVAPMTKAAAPIPSGPKLALTTLNEIRTIDDLKKIEPAHLRQGILSTQTHMIKNMILALAQANRLLPYYAVSAFEQSPLFRSYIMIGANMIHDEAVDRAAAFKAAAAASNSSMTLPEFEAIADLRKEIEKL